MQACQKETISGRWLDGLLRAFFAGDADAQRGADEADEPVSGGDDDAQDDSLAEGEAAGTGARFGGRRFASADFGHEVIVMGGASGLTPRYSPAGRDLRRLAPHLSRTSESC